MSAFAFNDLFYTDGRPAISVRATLTLLPETRRGRRSGWRPNHNFGPPENRDFYIGEIALESAETIEPEQTRNVIVRFLDGPGLREQLLPGRSWRVQEGPSFVATARVIEVVSET